MSEDYIFNKSVQYFRKGKWRHCRLYIGLVRRCQDILMAIFEECCEKIWNNNLVIYGYECNNVFVSLIGSNDMQLIKFETFEFATKFADILKIYIKDVSFKIQLKSCTTTQSVLQLNKWYMLHVQSNGMCITVDNGCKLITKWNRCNIGECLMDKCSLSIEIISKEEKSLYSFYRDDQFPIGKLFKAIQNLKFEFPLSKFEKFLSIPHRSPFKVTKQSVPVSNVKVTFDYKRDNNSSRDEDSFSIDEISSSYTPSISSYIFEKSNGLASSIKSYTHVDDKDEELMFQIDSFENTFRTINLDLQIDGYSVSTAAEPTSNEHNNKRLVDLERYPFESDLRNQGKLSTDLSSQGSSIQQTMFMQNSNIYENSRKGPCYQTLAFIKHHRKASSEVNFSSEIEKNVNISNSADVDNNLKNTFTPSSSEIISNYQSSLLMLSSSDISIGTPASPKRKQYDDGYLDFVDQKPTCCSEPYNDYYNINNMNNFKESTNEKYSLSFTPDDQYFNFQHISSKNYQNIVLPISHTKDVIFSGKNSTMTYVELDFGNKSNDVISRKPLPLNNYTEISCHLTEILKDLDDNIKQKSNKKKKSKFWKFNSKK